MQSRFVSIVSISLVLFVSAGLGRTAAAAATSAARIDQLLNDSGRKFVKKTDSVWYIPYHGNHLTDYKVILAVQDDLLVTFVTVTPKARLPLTAEFLQMVIKFNHTMDRVKVGLDGDGDLFVRCDSTVRIMDAAEFKLVVEQVAAAADEVYQGVQSDLISN